MLFIDIFGPGALANICNQGKLKFEQTQKVRSKVVSKWQPPLPHIRTEMQPSRPSIGSAGGLKLTFKMGSQSSRPTPTPPPPPPAPAPPVPTPTPGPGRVVLKFKPASKG